MRQIDNSHVCLEAQSYETVFDPTGLVGSFRCRGGGHFTYPGRLTPLSPTYTYGHPAVWVSQTHQVAALGLGN